MAEAKKYRVIDAIQMAMIDEMRRDESVFLMGEEVAGGSGMLRVGFSPFSAAAAGGFAAGAAAAGGQ